MALRSLGMPATLSKLVNRALGLSPGFGPDPRTVGAALLAVSSVLTLAFFRPGWQGEISGGLRIALLSYAGFGIFLLGWVGVVTYRWPTKPTWYRTVWRVGVAAFYGMPLLGAFLLVWRYHLELAWFVAVPVRFTLAVFLAYVALAGVQYGNHYGFDGGRP